MKHLAVFPISMASLLPNGVHNVPRSPTITPRAAERIKADAARSSVGRRGN